MEAQIAQPLDSRLSAEPSIRTLQTASTEGVVTAACVLDDNADERAATDAILSRIDAKALPADVGIVVVRDESSASELVRYDISNETLALVEVRRKHDSELRPIIERMAGVDRVEVCGIGEAEVHVSLDPLRLQSLGWAPSAVRDGVQKFLGTAAGNEGSAGLRNLVLGERDGTTVKLADIAVVKIGTSPHSCSCVVNGKPSLCVTVRGRAERGSAREASVGKAVRAELERWAAEATPPMGWHAATDGAAAPSSRWALWSVGGVLANPEDQTASAIDRAARGAIAQATTRVQVGKPEGSQSGVVDPAGELEVAGAVGETEPALSAAIERGVPWVRVSPGIGTHAAVFEALVRGANLAELSRIAQDLRTRLAGQNGVRQAVVLGVGQRAGLDIRLDRERAARAGVSVADAVQVLRLALDGDVIHTSLAAGGPLLGVRLQLAPVGNDVGLIASLAVPAATGSTVPLGSIANVSMRSRPDPILREDGQRAALVRAWGPDDAGEAWASGLAIAVQQAPLPPGCTVTWRHVR